MKITKAVAQVSDVLGSVCSVGAGKRDTGLDSQRSGFTGHVPQYFRKESKQGAEGACRGMII